MTQAGAYDGIQDCLYGDDESPQVCNNCSMPGLSYCLDMETCSSEEKLCDGVTDCHDFSDEFPDRCNYCELPGVWRCNDGMSCIKDESLCDGSRLGGCFDFSDDWDQNFICDAIGLFSCVVNGRKICLSNELFL